MIDDDYGFQYPNMIAVLCLSYFHDSDVILRKFAGKSRDLAQMSVWTKD